MNKSLLIYLLVGVGFYYLVTGDLFDGMQGLSYSSNTTDIEYKKYQSKDSVGQIILRVSGLDGHKQIDVWNVSTLRKEWLELFPDFAEMKLFIEDRIEGEDLTKRLKVLIGTVEADYLSGHITVNTAKQMLGVLK